MLKLAVIVLLIGAAAASYLPVVSPVLAAPRAIHAPLPLLGVRGIGPAVGNVFDGIDSLGLAYNNYDLGDGRVRLGVRYGHNGLGFGGYGYGGYGFGGYGLV